MAVSLNIQGLSNAERVQVTSASQMDFTRCFSLMIWVNTKDVTGATNYLTYCSRSDYYSIQLNPTTGYSNLSFKNPTDWNSLEDNTRVVTGLWYHLAGTYDSSAGANNFRFYTNGELSNSSTQTNAMSSSTGKQFNIGSIYDTFNSEGNGIINTRYMQGYFEDCRLYNRQLSDSEIQTIYACKGHDGIVEGLVGRWPMNEGYDGQQATAGTSVFLDVSDYKNAGVSQVGV